MFQKTTTSSTEALVDAMSSTDNAAFLLLADDQGTLRFHGLNAAHERMTGLKSADIQGKTPHESMPPRMADTVLANYRHAYETRQPFTYDELLDLPKGQYWWRTTLTPITQTGKVVAILGEAIDVTEYKTEISSLADEAARMRRRLTASEAFAQSSANATRGALNNIMSLLSMLKADAKMGPREDSLLELVVETADTAIATIDHIESRENGRRTPINVSPMDLGHLCRDFAALVDPGRTLDMVFPNILVEADREALSVMLRYAMEEAAVAAATRISVTATADAMTIDNLALILDFDCLANAQPKVQELADRGDVLGVAVRLDRDTESGLYRLKLSLPGRCLSELP